jgi:hypothetical protein
MAKSLVEATGPGQEVTIAGHKGTVVRSVAVGGGIEVTVIVSDETDRAPRTGPRTGAEKVEETPEKVEEAPKKEQAPAKVEHKPATIKPSVISHSKPAANK